MKLKTMNSLKYFLNLKKFIDLLTRTVSVVLKTKRMQLLHHFTCRPQ